MLTPNHNIDIPQFCIFFPPPNSGFSVSLLYHTFVNKSRRKPCMESAGGWMESRQRRVWHQAAGALFYTRFARFHARLRRGSIQRVGRVDSIPSLRAHQKLAHSLRGTPTTAWITKKELLVDKSSFFVGCGGGI